MQESAAKKCRAGPHLVLHVYASGDRGHERSGGFDGKPDAELQPLLNFVGD
jgi:hypothetical protein